jgi:hypothetical protein
MASRSNAGLIAERAHAADRARMSVPPGFIVGDASEKRRRVALLLTVHIWSV